MSESKVSTGLQWILMLSLMLIGSARVSASPQKAERTLASPASTASRNAAFEADPPNSSDLEITRQIRSAIVRDKSLSAYAHRVKVVTRSCSVTLTGSVKTKEEKNAVAAKAAEIAGQANVVNKLAVIARPPAS